MDDSDPLVERLRDLGRRPVDPAIAGRHLTVMAAAGGGRRRLGTRVKVGLAFLAGLLIGGTGLASAGALPGPAQDAAHTTLSKVGVKVPQGTERFNDPAVCGTDPATGLPFKNHGQYVKAHKGDPAAAQSRCGKPVKAGTEPEGAPGGKPAGAPDDLGPGGKGNGKAKGPKDKGPKDKGPKDKGPKQKDPAEAEPPVKEPGPPVSKPDRQGPTKTAPPPSTTAAPTTSSSTTTSAPPG